MDDVLGGIAMVIRGTFAVVWLIWATIAIVGFSPLLALAWLGLAALWVAVALPLMFIFAAMSNDMPSFQLFIECVSGWLSKVVEFFTVIPGLYRSTYYWVLGRPLP